MCGIFCSFNKETLNQLAFLNSSRGSHSFSICDESGHIIKDLGHFDLSFVTGDGYHVCHVQAPTTEERTIESVHPAEYDGKYLWHNGIVKDFDVKRLQQKQNNTIKWDTMLILREFIESPDNLSEINGSFACAYFDGRDFFVFRNEISPLFFDESLNISSVKFSGSTSLPPNQVFKLDLQNKKLENTNIIFKTKENPYYFG